MSTHSVEAKSETGRSGARVEFDKSTNTVKLTGFYDTYVKLNLRKNEWSLEDFLRILGIDEVIERKYKKEQKSQMVSVPETVEVKQTKESPKPAKNKVVAKKEIKPKAQKSNNKEKKATKVETKVATVRVRPKKVEHYLQDKTFTVGFENLKPATICFKYRKEKPDALKGSIYMFITHCGNRARFVPKGCNSLLEDIMDVKSKSLNKKNKGFTEINKNIDSIIDKCKKAFKDIDSKYKKDPAKYNSKIELENIRKKIMS